MSVRPRAVPAVLKAPWLLALVCGALAALAHPPFGLLPGLLGYGGMMLLAEDAGGWRKAFARGWMAGLAYFAIGCWWVAEAFLVDAEVFGWMAPFAIAALAGGLALFWGLALALYRLARIEGPWRVLVFAGVFAAVEWVRGHIFTGFPWNLPGTTWVAGGAVSQAASWAGAYGLTWITLALAATPALLLARQGRRTAIAAVAVAAGFLAGLWGHGAWRLSHPVAGDGLTVRIVQPMIPQSAKYDAARFQAMAQLYLNLTARPSASPPRLVVWPEGALPIPLESYLAPRPPAPRGAAPTLHAAIAAALNPAQTLLVGGWREERGPGRARFFNSLAAVRREGAGLKTVGLYDKFRLVPFGEFLPFESALGPLGVKQLVPLESFTSGPEPAAIDLGGLRVQPLICYEALFPGFTGAGERRGGERARLIVNISNDSWFGATSGPLQHLNQAAYRAIEAGLPMVRATPTGVSAIIDGNGRIGQRLEFGQRGVIDAMVPGALSRTVYGRQGEVVFLLLLGISALLLTLFRRKDITTLFEPRDDKHSIRRKGV